jgi:hypothetical protein
MSTPQAPSSQGAPVAVTASSKEAQVILPPPSATNPVPTLPAALRLDNQEQLLNLLQIEQGRQLLIFETDELRTLLLRQVVSDPNTRVYKGKKNWDAQNVFAGLPRSIVGTQIMPDKHQKWQEETAVDVITYFLHASSLSKTLLLQDKIQSRSTTTTTLHRVVYLPQPTAILQKMWSNTTLQNVSIHKLQLDLFPIEQNVLSLEYPSALKETDVDRIPSTCITTIARSLAKIQDVVGTIPRVQSLGPLGEEVVKKMMNMRFEEYLSSSNNNKEEEAVEIAAMMILDRKVDLVTPMVTPLTYEGLLDDTVGIDVGHVQIDVNILNPDNDERPDKEIVSLAVTGSDTLYAEVRDQHVEKFGSFLQNQAKALRESHANFTNKEKKKDLSEIHQFVKQIPIFTKNLRSLTNHIHLAELIKAETQNVDFREKWQTERSMIEGETRYEIIEDLIACQYPPYRVLRLLCLQSLCGGGIKSSRFDSLRRDFVQTYGYDYLFVLNNLEKSGLLRRRETLWMDSASSFSTLRKAMILINAEVDTVNPDDVSYVSSGYAPLTVRLVQLAIQGWAGKEETLRELPGRLVDVQQEYPPRDFESALKESRPSLSLGAIAKEEKKPTLMVVFVGGVTYMELAALRFLSKRPTFPYHIICVTTKIINGSTLLESLS